MQLNQTPQSVTDHFLGRESKEGLGKMPGIILQQARFASVAVAKPQVYNCDTGTHEDTKTPNVINLTAALGRDIFRSCPLGEGIARKLTVHLYMTHRHDFRVSYVVV